MRRKEKLLLQDTIISVIIITENDSDIIADILKQINEVLSKEYQNFEILVIDNYSSDDTVDKIRSIHRKIPHIRIIRLSKHYDTEIALTAGLDNCIGDYAVLFSIYTDPPSIIPVLIDELLATYDLVIATGVFEFADQLQKYKAGVIIEYNKEEDFMKAVKEIMSNYKQYERNALNLSKKFYYKKIYPYMFKF